MKLIYVTNPSLKRVHMYDEVTKLTACKFDIWHIRDFDPTVELTTGHYVVCKLCLRMFPAEFQIVLDYINSHSPLV